MPSEDTPSRCHFSSREGSSHSSHGAVLDHHTGNIQQMNALSNTFVTASRDGTVVVWDSRTMKLRSMCHYHSDIVVPDIVVRRNHQGCRAN